MKTLKGKKTGISEKTREPEAVFPGIAVIDKYEKSLKESEERFRMLVELASDAFFVIDGKGNFIQTNSKGYLELGYSKEEFLTMNIKDVIPGEELEKLPLALHEIEKGKTVFSERILRCKSGELISVEASLTRFPDGNIQAILRNISKRKKAEQALIQSQENYKSLIEYSPDGIFIHDERGEVFFANPAALKIMGINALEQLKSKHIFNYVLPEYHDKIREQKAKMDKGENIEFMITKIRRADGTTIEVESKPIEIVFEGKKSTLVVYHDISYQRQLEKEHLRAEIAEEANKKLQQEISDRKKAEEKVKQSLREKEVLLKEVHHRVKNNLQVISSILSLQSSYVTDKRTIDLLKESQNRIKSMSFIHEILYQTRDFSNINFSEYIVNLAGNLLQSYSRTNNIKMHQDVGNVFLNLDLAIPCGLIINELVSNALKYAFPDKNDGEISIVVKQSGDFVNIDIGDNGTGLPQNIDYRNTESLGLQLVMTLVEQIEGDITLKGGKGTNFSIVFQGSRTKKNK